MECGAADGSFLSNTLFLEREREWTGLLMEPDPKNYANLRDNRRAVFTSQSCLAFTPHPSQASFTINTVKFTFEFLSFYQKIRLFYHCVIN